MNWDAIGAVGEIIGAIAVLVTLLYLAIQIRHLREQTESNELGNLVSSLNDYVGRIADSEDLAKVLIRGRVSYEDLTSDEKLRFDSSYLFLLNNLESWHIQLHKLPGSSEIHAENIKSCIDHFCNNTGFREFWKEAKPMFPHLAELLESTLERS